MEYETLYTAEEIEQVVDRIAAELNESCRDEWLFMCVLTGGLFFGADVARKLTFPIIIESLKVTRYHNTTEGSLLAWHLKPKSDLKGRRVLLVDDIFDEGQTLEALHDYCLEQGAAEVKTVILLDKQHDRKMVKLRPDVVGLDCPDHYVFGYGMDVEGKFRNWPGIYYLANKD